MALSLQCLTLLTNLKSRILAKVSEKEIEARWSELAVLWSYRNLKSNPMGLGVRTRCQDQVPSQDGRTKFLSPGAEHGQ